MVIRKLISIAVAVLFAAQIPALIFAVWGGQWILLTYSFAVALAHAVLLGLPLFLFLNWMGWANALSAILAGFAIGSIPIGVFFWLLRNTDSGSSSWSGETPTMVEGVLTLAGWIEYAETLALFGGFGAIGGLAFWLVLKTARPRAGYGRGISSGANLPIHATNILHKSGATIVFVFAVGIASIPAITMDRSCHNMFLDGRQSIGPVLTIDLQIFDSEWSGLLETVRKFAKDHDLSFRDTDETSPGVVPRHQLSLCNDSGVNVYIRKQVFRTVEGNGQYVVIYQMHENADWQELAGKLVEVLNTRWPNKVWFKKGNDRVAPTPDNLLAD